MMRLILFYLFLFASAHMLIAATPTFFFEATNERLRSALTIQYLSNKRFKKQTLQQFLKRKLPPPVHIFGTVHSLPFAFLPPIVKPMVCNHDVLMDEVHSGKSDFSDPPVSNWIRNGYIRAITEQNYFASLEPDKQSWLRKYISLAYPKLLDGSCGYQFNDFTPKGLRNLYNVGRHQQGMDIDIGTLQKVSCLRCPLDYATDGYKYRTEHDSATCKAASYRDHLNQHYNFDLHVLGIIIDDDMKFDGDSLPNTLMNQKYLTGILGKNDTEEFLSKPLLKNRNLSWFPEILEYIKSFNDSKIMVSVGASHLHGQYGLLRLFQETGYEIRRLYTDGTFKQYLPAMGIRHYQLIIQAKKSKILLTQKKKWHIKKAQKKSSKKSVSLAIKILKPYKPKSQK